MLGARERRLSLSSAVPLNWVVLEMFLMFIHLLSFCMPPTGVEPVCALDHGFCSQAPGGTVLDQAENGSRITKRCASRREKPF